MRGSYRGDSWEQPDRTINEAANMITNTTGTAVATGRGIGRTSITDHLALSFFHSRVVLSKHQVNSIMVFLGFSQREASPSREMPITSIAAARSLLWLDPCYTMDPLRSAVQDSRYASKY